MAPPPTTLAPAAPAARPTPRILRALLSGLGCVLLGLAALGAVLPGLPTTVFLLGALACFARSSPRLAARVRAAPLFRPVRAWIVPGAVPSRRARAAALAGMWTAIALTTVLLVGRGAGLVVPALLVLAGIVGSVFVVRRGRAAPSPAAGTASGAPRG